MGLFKTRQPRKFNRVSIYGDERKEKLAKLVAEVKREQGLATDEETAKEQPTSFEGKFAQFTPRAHRAAEGGRKLSWPIVLIVVVILIMAWHYIITGKI